MIRVMLSKRGSQPSRTFAQSAIFRAPARCPGTALPTLDLNVVMSWPQITQRWREPLFWRLTALHRRRLRSNLLGRSVFVGNGRNRRNLAIGMGIDEGPRSIRKLSYSEIKTSGKAAFPS